MGRLIGYARVSMAEQDLGLQLAALRSVGCSDAHIFCDTASGARTARPGLEACVHALAPGDTLVVWRLDRLGRSMTHLVTLIQALLQRTSAFARSVMGPLIRRPPRANSSSTSFPRWRSSNGG
jgi:DNA invertase Pin-like site-specific DNA recombinase